MRPGLYVCTEEEARKCIILRGYGYTVREIAESLELPTASINRVLRFGESWLSEKDGQALFPKKGRVKWLTSDTK